MKAFILSAFMIVFAICLSCSESPQPTPPATGGNEPPELTGFSPLSGKKGTVIKIQGRHFGTDKAKVSLQINGLKAVINTVTDSEISAVVPDKCGLGKLVLTINGKEISSSAAFRYLYTATTSYFSGSGLGGYEDGAPLKSKFGTLYNIAMDGKGVMFAADLGNCMVRRIDTDGSTSTVAGAASGGFKDGKGNQGLMKFPIGIELAPDGSIFVADHENHAIRQLFPDGTLTTVAGEPDRPGSADGGLASAQFNQPYGVKLDKTGTLWICDTKNGLIRKLANSQVTTFAGSTPGYADGKLRDAKFYMPSYLNFDENGNIFVADKHNHCIRKITPDGMVTTFSGTPTQVGYRDGEAGQAMFNQPCNIQIDKLGNLYVNDLWNHCIRLVYPDGYVTTLAGKGGTEGYNEGTGENALFKHPQGCTLDKDENLFVTDSANQRIRKLTIQ
ncbi:sugar lactone lactonase YvrE [Dyadobacter sp. BE34]|uniref:Sugar lactone lactonase YvrE n=1 Tax=Dyadobacter fermentans TaxID=94254 RepID=A0ABU1R464_9BACT|nr:MULTISPECIES: IPT/TIG domain-containing protein [Dyadobacter]MDR6808170.1 sugar lactone lactonase YvrE [Dyadobacter fermentans]MDR7046014.1 sugar lactone lactonase YvrE [Dyadobacter sp. BE242]MDR7200327.1 sugar lactone lactonase YvrE [Dyadobacter sp. BE34]MDR7218287.1 sugar lactone lactonase YvrE [Dyadobacter sp. BE31]MDR7266218.1 sugar lactone lactonase YvrE [Dyadobacter sp. BE32]